MNTFPTLPLIPQDKANHAIYGAILATIILLITTYFHISNAPLISLGFTSIVGAYKELSDWYQNKIANTQVHNVDFFDWLAASLGGALVYLLTEVGMRII
jgi:hypothetical protein